MRLNWWMILWIAAYTAVGPAVSNYVAKYIDKLALEVARIDRRYSNRLYLRIRVTRTALNEFLVNAAFIILWPAICIASILKAEWEYDLIMHHTPFGKKRSR